VLPSLANKRIHS